MGEAKAGIIHMVALTFTAVQPADYYIKPEENVAKVFSKKIIKLFTAWAFDLFSSV